MAPRPSALRPSVRRRAAAAFLAVASVALLAGCPREDAGPSSAGGPREPPGIDDAAESATPARRIVSLAPAFTETLIALGAADAIVGIGGFDPEVPGRPDVPRLGDAFTVSRETVLALRPDLVLVNAKGLEEALRPVAPSVRVVAPPTDRLEDVRRLVVELAERTGRRAEGRDLLGRIDESIEAARRRAADRRAAGTKAPRVLVVVQQRPLYAVGGTSFLHDLLVAVGAENATGDLGEPWPCLAEEAAVARSPDVILDASVGDVDTESGRRALVERWNRFPSIPAVRDGRVLAVREDSLFRGGPRIPEAVATLERLLFGESGSGKPGGTK